MGCRVLFNNLLYATAKINELHLLTLDGELVGFLEKEKATCSGNQARLLKGGNALNA
jgi:hypothetical protein